MEEKGRRKAALMKAAWAAGASFLKAPASSGFVAQAKLPLLFGSYTWPYAIRK